MLLLLFSPRTTEHQQQQQQLLGGSTAAASCHIWAKSNRNKATNANALLWGLNKVCTLGLSRSHSSAQVQGSCGVLLFCFSAPTSHTLIRVVLPVCES